MNIKDQVLSIAQVRELQELGFDFRKYSSACVIEAKDRNKYIVDRRLIGLHIGFMETEVIEYHETMTIGDIMECLPKNIKFEGWEYDVSIYRNQISYYDRNIDKDIFVSKAGLSLIDALFECLVWCIKEKHIEL